MKKKEDDEFNNKGGQWDDTRRWLGGTVARAIAICHPNRKSKRWSEGGLESVPCLDISARRCFLSGDVSWKAISRRYVCVSYALLTSRFATRPRRSPRPSGPRRLCAHLRRSKPRSRRPAGDTCRIILGAC